MRPADTKGLARHPVPIMLLRAADGSQRRVAEEGVGAGMLKDAIRRTLQAADIASIRAFPVHAKDDHARSFYEHISASSPHRPTLSIFSS